LSCTNDGTNDVKSPRLKGLTKSQRLELTSAAKNDSLAFAGWRFDAQATIIGMNALTLLAENLVLRQQLAVL
jgi:hypothetical protein